MGKYVYLIKNSDESYYKIGVAKNPQERLRNHQTSNSSKLIITELFLTDIPHLIEKTLHRRYSYLKKNGEWFDLSIEEEKNFIENCRKIEKSVKFLKDSGNVFI